MGERTRELLLLTIGDILCFNLALWLTLLFRYAEIPTLDRLQLHFGPFLLLSAIWIFIFYIAGLYDKHTTLLKSLLLSRILNTQIANILIAAFLFVLLPFSIAPKTNLVIYLFISIALITLWRLVLFNYLSPKNTHKAVLIADGPEAVELADEINNNTRYNYSFVRIIDDQTVLYTQNFESKLIELVEEEGIRIIVAKSHGPHIEKVLPSIFDLSFLQFEFTFLDFDKLYEDTFDKIPLTALQYDWFISNVSQAENFIYVFLKRAGDVIGALLLMIPCLAIFPLVALAIKIEDRGVLFYRTERVGQYNRPISIYKFRTKTGTDTGAEALKSTLVDTRIGTFLRKTRIDELPQLLNVLRGDLSFIGPRPEMPSLAQVYAEEIPYYNTRHFIKPGLSGWAQINNSDAPRGGVDTERTKAKLSYDLYYLKHRSVLLDLQIGLKTLSILVMRTGT